MNITLNSFRHLANGTHNLGFVQLTRETDGSLGIGKANNFAHRFWRNTTSEAASADNLTVKRELLRILQQSGACTGFLTELRQRLGINERAATASVLTRETLREILSDFDQSVNSARRITLAFNEMISQKFPERALRTQLTPQLDAFRSRFVDAWTSSRDRAEKTNLIRAFTHALSELRDAYSNDNGAIIKRNLVAIRNEIERCHRAEVEAQLASARAERFNEVTQEFNRAILPDIDRIKRSVFSMPGFNPTQLYTIGSALISRIGSVSLEIQNQVEREMLVQRTIDAAEARTRLMSTWNRLRIAIDRLLGNMVAHGVSPAVLENPKLLTAYVNAKLDTM